MDADALLPGLQKVLAQRIGWTGYHLGTASAVGAALVLVLTPVGIVVEGPEWSEEDEDAEA